MTKHKKMKTALLTTILFFATIFAQGQITGNFGKQLKVLIETPAVDLIANGKLLEKTADLATYQPAQKLDNFKVLYAVTTLGSSLSATYTKKGDEKAMNDIYEQLGTIQAMVEDPKDFPDMMKKEKDKNIIHKTIVKDYKTMKKTCIITLDNTGKIYIEILNK